MPAFLLPQDPESVGKVEAPHPHPGFHAVASAEMGEHWRVRGESRLTVARGGSISVNLLQNQVRRRNVYPHNPPIPKSHRPQRTTVLFQPTSFAFAHMSEGGRAAPCRILHNLLSHHYIQCNVEALRQFCAF